MKHGKTILAVCLALAFALALIPMATSSGSVQPKGAGNPKSLAATVRDANVQLSTQKLTVDGTEVRIQAYNIDGHNYFRLRDLAAALNGTDNQFNVLWDAGRNAVQVITRAPYPETEIAVEGTDQSDSAVPSGQTVWIDGEPVTDLSVYNIGGSNYFQLAELQSHLGYQVSYNAETRTMELRTRSLTRNALEISFAADYDAVRANLSLTRGGGMVVLEEAADAAEPMEMPADSAVNTTGASAQNESEGADYSGTNVQVEGIDEGDIVKTDGNYIYVLNGEQQLTIIRADGPSSEVVSRTKVGMAEHTEERESDMWDYAYTGKHPQEMFINGERLVILSNYNSYHEYADDDGYHWEEDTHSCVDIYDVSNPAAPVPVSALGQDGNILRSRMLDGHVYLVTSYWVYDWDNDDPYTYVPCLYEADGVKTMTADCIAICAPGNNYVVVCDYDIAGGKLNATQSLLGSGDELYMSGEHLYVLGSNWSDEEVTSYPESVYTVTQYINGVNTEIYRFDLTDGLTLTASGKVPGSIESQFSADEWNGYFRIVTTRNETSYRVYEDKAYEFRNYQWDERVSGNGLYILDENLNLIGSVTDLAPGEQIYSARFDGPIAYFCTFRTVDPLFTVDTSDPANPTVSSALKLSGFSEYLHSWTPGKLFGFGYEADEDTGLTKGLKLVMFDTSNQTDVTVENSLRLDDTYSEALYNHKAFFIDANKNIIGFPGDGGYALYAYDENSGFTRLGRYDWRDAWNLRGLYIGDYAYLVGNREMAVIAMTDWSRVLSLSITPDETQSGK